MLTIKLDKHTTEDVQAISVLRSFGFSEEEIQRMYDDQKKKDEEEDRE